MSSECLNVLIAEDEVLVAEAVKGMLAALGHTVVGHAANGCQAVALATALQPDAILLDIKMPEMNGLEAARQISETCPTPIVVLTAFQSREFVTKASMVGAGAFLTKPTTLPELERALIIATARFNDVRDLKHQNEALSNTLEQVRQLKGILPICSGCKKIRDEKGGWHQVESYIHDYTGVDFSHGICPDCVTELYDDYEDLL